MKNTLIFLLALIILLLMLHSSQTCIEGFSKINTNNKDFISMSLSTRNFTDVNNEIETSWYLKDGNCKKIEENPNKIRNMIEKLGVGGVVYNNEDDCNKSIKYHNNDNIQHHNENKINRHINPRSIRFICEKNNGISHNNHPANDHHLNPNIHYANVHLNTIPSINDSAIAHIFNRQLL